ncbi:MAG: hypothetical protein ICCCNLDF_01665 [Planctomycetes bacterium]|nr:hypothetical protein [Planctomycetota bacterium]
MRMNQKKFDALVAQTAPKRYMHFVKMAADQRQVWGLYSKGWALAATDDGKEAFPVWPAEDFAAACATLEWAGYEPKAIDLDTLLDVLVPKLKESNTELAVFPTPHDKGVTPALRQLVEDVRVELAKIE